MKIIGWNVNGLRACITKGFKESIGQIDPDVICIGETKCTKDQVDLSDMGYYSYFNSAQKKGYSGTLIMSKVEPLSISYGLGIEQHDTEGRVICAEFEDKYVVVVYTPNSKRNLSRLTYRQLWEEDFRKYLKDLEKTKPVIVVGDLNVAHQEIDLANPKTNAKNAGFTNEERAKFDLLLEAGFIDTFRFINPDLESKYTWWSYMNNVRARNIGWRIDYILVSSILEAKIKEVNIFDQVLGSDHCPVYLELND